MNVAKRLAWWKQILYSFVPLFTLLFIAEIAIRVHEGCVLSFDNFRRSHIELLKGGWPVQSDETLGYVPVPGYSGMDNVWNKRVSITLEGLRSNGTDTRYEGYSILALGDSFTFGDQVADEETWSTYLERALSHNVLNAGVTGYGMDQMVLRAEQLIPEHRPGIVLIALIADDIDRCALACRHAWKPYFELKDNELVLQNVPVPQQNVPKQYFRNLLGHSALAHSLFSRYAQRWWNVRSSTIQVHFTREKLNAIACLLLYRLQNVCQLNGSELILVTLGRAGNRSIDSYISGPTDEQTILAPVKRCASESGIALLALDDRFATLIQEDPDLLGRFMRGHMTAAGNEWIALEIAEFISDLQSESEYTIQEISESEEP